MVWVFKRCMQVVLKSLEGHSVSSMLPIISIINQSNLYMYIPPCTYTAELFWNTISHTRSDAHDDQVKFNYALEGCNIKWLSKGRDIETQAINGKCGLNELKVTVLPKSLVCRNCQKDRNSYYVWHGHSKRTGDMKIKAAISGYAWYLQQLTVNEDGSVRESKRTENLKGLAWLKALSVA